MLENNWVRIRIKNLMEINQVSIRTGPFGTQLHASDYVVDGTPVIHAKNLGLGTISTDDLKFVNDSTVKRLSAHLLQEGDIILSRRGAVDLHGYITEKDVGSLQGTGCIRLRFNSPRIDSHFVSYSFQTREHRQMMLNRGSFASTMPHLNQDIISRTDLFLPPIRIQQVIVSVLSAYDNLIENNRRRIQLLEEMARALYREWFVHFRFQGHEDVELMDSELGEIPKEWKIVELEKIAAVHRGRSYRSENLVEEFGWPFLNLKCINRDGGFRTDGLKRYDGEFKETQTTEAGNIIMAVTDMTQEKRIVARAARVPLMEELKFVFSMDLVKIEPRIANITEYIYCMLRYSRFSDEVKEYANGVNVLHLSPDHIRSFKFECPPENLQKEFSKIISNTYSLQDILNHQNEILKVTRNLLLPKLVSGQINVSDLDIEIPPDTHKTSKYSDQPTLEQWLDGDDQHDPS